MIALPLIIWGTLDWGTLVGLPVAFWLLLGVTFLISTLTQFFAPAEQAIIPLIVEKRNLLSANSLYTTTMMASVIIGFAVGEPFLALSDALLSRLGLSNNGPALLGGVKLCPGWSLPGTGKSSVKNGCLKTITPSVFGRTFEMGLNTCGITPRFGSAIIQLVVYFPACLRPWRCWRYVWQS